MKPLTTLCHKPPQLQSLHLFHLYGCQPKIKSRKRKRGETQIHFINSYTSQPLNLVILLTHYWSLLSDVFTVWRVKCGAALTEHSHSLLSVVPTCRRCPLIIWRSSRLKYKRIWTKNRKDILFSSNLWPLLVLYLYSVSCCIVSCSSCFWSS